MHNPMRKNQLQHVFVLAVLLLSSSSFSAMCKNPVLKNTRWKAVREMFVADAGTMTITHTLEFGRGKDVVLKEESFLPSHPAMYMNPDGTVDRIPASSSERSETGTYRFRRGILAIMTEDGHTQEYRLQPDGTFVREEPWGDTLVFSRSEE